MSVYAGPFITTDSLQLSFDPVNLKTYPGNGTTAYDLTRNGYNGTMANVTHTGNSFIFTSTANSLINYGAILPFTTSDFSIGVFFRTSILTNYNSLFDKLSSGGTYRLLYYADGRLIVDARAANSDAGSVNTVVSTLTHNTWYYAVSTFNYSSNTFSLFVNGDRKVIGTITIPVANGGQSIYTGYAQNNGVYGSFTMGPLHVYSKTLSNVEIQQNFNAYRSRYAI